MGKYSGGGLLVIGLTEEGEERNGVGGGASENDWFSFLHVRRT